MNFLKTLGGLVGPSATGGLPYTIDTPCIDGNVSAGGAMGESVLFEGLPDFVLHSGKSKQDPSHLVSIFKSRHPAGQQTQNSLRRIKTLRHPNILAYLDGIEVPNNGPVIIVTEHVMPLSEYLTAIRMEYGKNSAEFTMCVSWGLRSVLMALQFINVDCKLLHGRLTPQSIFVTKGGDWKLGGFELTAEITCDGPSSIYTSFQQYADANYKSPECQRSDWKSVALGPSYGVDVWAFACLMFFVFNDGQFRLGDVSTAANIPSALRNHFRKATDDNAARRPSPQQVLKGSYFITPFIKQMDFLENLAVKASDEKVAFYKELCASLGTLPRCFGVHKILPVLKQVVEFGAATGGRNGPIKLDPSASHMLPAMVQIGSSLSAEEFKAEILPIIVKLFSCSDRAVRVQLLQMMETFAVHFEAKLVNSSVVFDNLCSGFSDTTPVLRELTVKSMLHIADKLSDSNLNNRVVKYFAKLQSDPEPAIRTNTTICLGKIASKLNDSTRPRVLFPAFAKALKDPFPHARLAGLRSLTACQEYFTPQGMAISIVPAISPLLLDESLPVREQAKKAIDIFIGIVLNEAVQIKIRDELKVKECELRHDVGNGDHIGDSDEIRAPLTFISGSQSSSGYATSLSAWATSAVATNVNKLIGSGGASSSIAQSSATVLSSQVDDFLAEDGWGNRNVIDDLDELKHASSVPGLTLLAKRGSSLTPASSTENLVSGSLKPSTYSSVSRDAGKTYKSLTENDLFPSSSLAINCKSAWENDGWGGDDDLNLDAMAPQAKISNTHAQNGIGGLGSSISAKRSAITHSTERNKANADAPEKATARSKNLGAIKLMSADDSKADEWNWDF